ncbi:MAG: hypothetical protein ACYS8Z_04520, partial [Planctomycetota bacterium]
IVHDFQFILVGAAPVCHGHHNTTTVGSVPTLLTMQTPRRTAWHSRFLLEILGGGRVNLNLAILDLRQLKPQ